MTQDADDILGILLPKYDEKDNIYTLLGNKRMTSLFTVQSAYKLAMDAKPNEEI